MATNQNEKFAQNFFAWWRTTLQIFLKKFCQNPCKKTAVKANFLFSHYKSVDTLSCRSNQSTYETAISATKFVEAHAMNISAKFQLYPPYSFWELIFVAPVLAWAT